MSDPENNSANGQANGQSGGRKEGQPAETRSAQPTHQAVRRAVAVLIVLFVVAVVVAIAGILPRIHARNELRRQTDSMAVRTVSVITTENGAPVQEIVLPGTIQAYQDAPIYARTNGYVKSWFHDIGSHVRKGELLAVIATPELDRQVDEARAELATAQANLRLSHATAQRYEGLRGTQAVSQQAIDTAMDTEKAQQSSVTVAQENLNHLLELQSFERVYAPFNGVVTARNTDVGQLVQAGSNGGTGSASALSGGMATNDGSSLQELFHVSNIGVVRIFVDVPGVYVPEARPGVETDIDVPGYAGRIFKGKIVRTANALRTNTRTLLVEVDIDNRKGELLPGSYAHVHLKLPMKHPTLIVPVSALMFRSEGLRVVTLDNEDHVHLASIQVGRDWGTKIEVLAGLTPGQRIVNDPPDSIMEGEKVNVAKNSSAGDDAGGQS